jgi:probable rRNA maturation factor
MTASTSTPSASTAGSAVQDRDEAGPADADLPGEEPPEPESRPPAVATSLDVQASHHTLDEPARSWLRDHVAALLPLLARAARRVAISVLDDDRMIALHRRHLGLDSTTDVLTFEQSDPDDPVDVDIAVCADEAARRAAALDHDLRHELLLYVTHGLLHCTGFDDHDDEAAAAMHAEEDRLLTAIGVGPVYRSGEGESC